MGGTIGSAMSAAQRSLGTFSRSLAVIQDNIANAATPGYARQRVSLSAVVVPGSGASQGVEVNRVESMRSNLLDYQVAVTTQRQAQLEKTTEFFSQLEPSFRLDGGGVNDALDGLFAAASRLSLSPSDPNLRRVFRDSAEGFAASTRSLYNDLGQQGAALELEARSVIKRIDALSEQIADLESKRGGADPRFPNSGLETQVQQKLEELSQLIGFTTQRQADGTLSVIAGATPLITGARTRGLSLTLDNSGLHVFNDAGQDVTASLEGQGGKLGALLEARNQTLPSLEASLNRYAKSVADQVNEQLSHGVDALGSAGEALFSYTESAVTGSGRTAGTAGAATPTPPTILVAFSNGLSGTIAATLDTFFVASAPPSGASAGDTATVRLVSADGKIDRTLTTAPLAGGETAADLALRLNDQVALDPELAGLVTFSDQGGALEVVLSDQAKQGFTLSSSTSNPGFTTGLEPGAALGGQSAEEIAAALNAQVALDSNLASAGVRFSAVNGEVRLDADVRFGYSVFEGDPSATGFASGLGGTVGSAGGANAAGTLAVRDIPLARIAAGTLDRPDSGDNLIALEALSGQRVLDGATYTEFFSGIINDVGQQSETAQTALQTQAQVTAAAVNLRDSFSGVDVNEEAIELMRFEQGYSAMLRVIQTLGQLTDEVLKLV
ncbi:MAG: hypothetical protein KDC27_12670 [Acidobacteria bacterium]|nr:hypothetical protein [Acidobacteriota bacterium]